MQYKKFFVCDKFVLFLYFRFVVSQVGHVRHHGGHAYRAMDGAKHSAAGGDVRTAYRAAAVGLRHILSITKYRKIVKKQRKLLHSHGALVHVLLFCLPPRSQGVGDGRTDVSLIELEPSVRPQWQTPPSYYLVHYRR